MTGAVWLLMFVTASRLTELRVARRNTAALLQRGAVEHAAGHYPAIVALHAAWLATVWALGWNQPLHPAWLAVFAVLQAGRLWVLLTLGRRWTTRILTVPGEVLVSRGPFRFIPHPNYAVVVGEIAVLPLALGLPWIAVLFTVLNAAVLSVRIRAETAALHGA